MFHVEGRRWFDKINGNTYHAVRIWKDGELLTSIPYQYGYGNQWEYTACDWLEKNGYIPREHHSNGSTTPSWQVFKDYKISSSVVDVTRKRDL